MKHETLEYGVQPIDALLQQHGLENRDIAADNPAITFKVLKKARKGRRLTRRMQEKVLAALNAKLPEPVTLEDLFNYKG